MRSRGAMSAAKPWPEFVSVLNAFRQPAHLCVWTAIVGANGAGRERDLTLKGRSRGLRPAEEGDLPLSVLEFADHLRNSIN